MHLTKRFAATMIAATLLAGLGLSRPAQAAESVIMDSDDCAVGTSFHCQTNAVQALGGNMVLNIWANAGTQCTYQVVDVANGAVVRRETIWAAARPTLTNVYSWYKLELGPCYPGSWGYIEG